MFDWSDQAIADSICAAVRLYQWGIIGGGRRMRFIMPRDLINWGQHNR